MIMTDTAPTAPTALERRPVLATMHAPTDERWNSVVRVLPPPDQGLLRWLSEAVHQARDRDAVIVRGTVGLADRYRDLLAVALLRRLRNDARLVVSDATIEPRSRAATQRSGALGRLAGRLAPVGARALVRLADGPQVRWCVLSTEEERTFSTVWGVPPARVVFTPFTHTLFGTDDPGVADEGFLFSGGESLRDYPLLEAAARTTRLDIRVASRWRPSPGSPIRSGRVSPAEFNRLLATCHGLVLPLQAAVRSAGQQTYLNAMALGKPVIVTEAAGVRDHIRDGVTGVVVAAEAGALRAAMLHLADPHHAEQYREMGERARADVLARFTPERYRERLLAVAGIGGPAGPVTDEVPARVAEPALSRTGRGRDR